MSHEAKPADELEDCASEAALYVLGALPPEEARSVEMRLRSGCSFCAAQVAQYSVVAEQLSLSVDPVAPPPSLKEKLLVRLKDQKPAAQPIEQRTVVRTADSPWVEMSSPGVTMRSLIGKKTFLVRMQPGAVLPKHDHRQAEQCYVLSGSEHDPVCSSTGCTLFIAYAD